MSDAPGVAPIVVLPVQPGDPPFRVVEIGGQTVGIAHDMIDVISLAHASGRHGVDLDDPALVRWVGGGKYRWKP
ncbi:hypothetical protein [Streptomyces spongiicola]|uniref:hypothetical protein n=1 Tax=Streptomyces spongiicola TaxID=1690221 RepID=UPI0015589455|nr:hypothetical protein [Streptomyces spongiicola]